MTQHVSRFARPIGVALATLLLVAGGAFAGNAILGSARQDASNGLPASLTGPEASESPEPTETSGPAETSEPPEATEPLETSGPADAAEPTDVPESAAPGDDQGQQGEDGGAVGIPHPEASADDHAGSGGDGGGEGGGDSGSSGGGDGSGPGNG